METNQSDGVIRKAPIFEKKAKNTLPQEPPKSAAKSTKNSDYLVDFEDEKL